MNLPHLKVVGRNSSLFEAFSAGTPFPCISRCMNNSEKLVLFAGELSTAVNLERWEHADVRLLITTHTNNKYLFDGKATNKDAFEKIEQLTKA